MPLEARIKQLNLSYYTETARRHCDDSFSLEWVVVTPILRSKKSRTS